MISPKGEFYVTDGHHGIYINLKLLGTDADLTYNVRVLKDYRQINPHTNQAWTYNDFITHLLTPVAEGGLGKGQFTAAIRELPPIERFKYLPKRFSDITDNPMRSLVGAALKRYGVIRANMIDYVEFYVGDMIWSQG